MTEEHLREELDQEPFKPLRLHLVSGKAIDVLRAGTAWTLDDRLLVFRNPRTVGSSAEGYDVVAYHNIERIEQLALGGRESTKRKGA
jgi:hypothetical protein